MTTPRALVMLERLATRSAGPVRTVAGRTATLTGLTFSVGADMTFVETRLASFTSTVAVMRSIGLMADDTVIIDEVPRPGASTEQMVRARLTKGLVRAPQFAGRMIALRLAVAIRGALIRLIGETAGAEFTHRRDPPYSIVQERSNLAAA